MQRIALPLLVFSPTFFYFFFLHVMVYIRTRTFAVFANTFVVLLVLLACAAFMQLLRLMLIGYG